MVVAFLDKVVDIDQSPIGRTPRSNPATKQGLGVKKAELKSEFKPDLAAVRNQVLATRAATFLGSLLYITFRL